MSDDIAMADVCEAVELGKSPLLTIKEVAKILRCTPGQVRNYIHRKENPLKCVQFSPRRLYVLKEELNRFIFNNVNR